MGAPPTLERLNHRHDAIILWLLLNPERPLGDCAEAFGYTQPWLSRIIHTDMFQAAYKAKAEELKTGVIHDIKSKLNNFAAVALDKATERIEQGLASERFLGESMKNSLAALGYGSPVAQVDARSQQVHFHLDAESLRSARERAAQLRSGTTTAKLEGSEPEGQTFDMEDFPKSKGPVQ